MPQTKKTKLLDGDYWDNQYKANTTGWDMGTVSPPLKNYIDQLTDKDIRILIPGCGNTYEAEYLLEQGFTNVTVIDIAPTLVDKLKQKFKNNSSIKIILIDFFKHQGQYDLILEQTFFCALNPELRKDYVDKMYTLLSSSGKLVGLLFGVEFEKAGPPFGGNKNNYEILFQPLFRFITFETCINSHPKRANSELFIILKKK
ncbi:MAG: methyltransferase domain-containing protein [Bacteroidota bacterium]